MTNHPLNNSMVLCTKDNKEELAKFLRNHKVNNNMTIVSADLTDNFYFGLIDGEFKFANYHNVQDEIQKTNISYYTLEQAIAKFGHETITVHVGSVDNTPKSFPRIMWVKMDNQSSVWSRAVVIAFARGKYIVWGNYTNLETLSDFSDNPSLSSQRYATDWYDMAVEEDEVKAVTKQDIADMLNISIEHLIIK